MGNDTYNETGNIDENRFTANGKGMTIIFHEKNKKEPYSTRGKFNYESAQGVEVYKPTKKSKPAPKDKQAKNT